MRHPGWNPLVLNSPDVFPPLPLEPHFHHPHPLKKKKKKEKETHLFD